MELKPLAIGAIDLGFAIPDQSIDYTSTKIDGRRVADSEYPVCMSIYPFREVPKYESMTKRTCPSGAARV